MSRRITTEYSTDANGDEFLTVLVDGRAAALVNTFQGAVWLGRYFPDGEGGHVYDDDPTTIPAKLPQQPPYEPS